MLEAIAAAALGKRPVVVAVKVAYREVATAVTFEVEVLAAVAPRLVARFAAADIVVVLD
jgi:hypothetical protein